MSSVQLSDTNTGNFNGTMEEPVLQNGPSMDHLPEPKALYHNTPNSSQTARVLRLGSMTIKQQPLSVLLVFGKDDPQCGAFTRATEYGGYHCDVTRTESDALTCFRTKQHDVIIVDTRNKKYLDGESTCRRLRALPETRHSVLVAVTKSWSSDRELPLFRALLDTGFNKRLVENTNPSVCLTELMALEAGEVALHAQLQGAEALTAALDHVTEAVEISSDSHEIQYVNPSFERIFGYSAEEVVGKDIRDLGLHSKNDRIRHDVEAMNASISMGKAWDGLLTSYRKSGEPVPHHARVTPITGPNGLVRHVISTKTPVPDVYGRMGTERYNGDVSSISSVNTNKVHRRDSILRMHSMTIEAPITQVINIINAAQEDSPLLVSQSLDKVLEILRSSELYSPYLSHQVKDDQMTHDLVGGLMTTNVKKFNTAGDGSFTKTATAIMSPGSQSAILAQASPEIQNLLVNEVDWAFNIVELERVTKKKPLVHLALKTFRRFGVAEFLRVSEKELAMWLQVIEENYHSSNTYHNSTHAADVMNATSYFLCRDRIKNVFDQMDEVASLIAAIIHDVDHPGRTNSFLVNSGNPLSYLYNDLAVLESHHVSLAFRLTMRDPRVNIFKNLDSETLRSLRQQIIDMVLATEMTKHFEHLTKFSSIVQTQGIDEDVTSGKNSPDSGRSRSRLSSPENKTLIKRMLIKCADVSNPVRPLHLCEEWAYRISDEYFQQTDEEKEKKQPVVMPVFDRLTCNVPKSQISFIDFFINDMFETWDNFCDTPELMKHLAENYQFWKQKEAEAETSNVTIKTAD